MHFKSLVEIASLQRSNNFNVKMGYLSHQFQKFFNLNRILQRLSCPYISRQNSLVERKHRHSMEVGPSLLAQSYLPTKFWVEAFVTTIYLINRTPTSVLDNGPPPLFLLLLVLPCQVCSLISLHFILNSHQIMCLAFHLRLPISLLTRHDVL